MLSDTNAADPKPLASSLAVGFKVIVLHMTLQPHHLLQFYIGGCACSRQVAYIDLGSPLICFPIDIHRIIWGVRIPVFFVFAPPGWSGRVESLAAVMLNRTTRCCE